VEDHVWPAGEHANWVQKSLTTALLDWLVMGNGLGC